MPNADWTGTGRGTAEVYRAMAERELRGVVDARSDEDRRWLAALIWPEQVERAERLDRALDVVGDDPPRLETEDLQQDVPALVADAPAGATIVVFHSAVLAYLGPEDRRQFTEIMRSSATRSGGVGVQRSARRHCRH